MIRLSIVILFIQTLFFSALADSSPYRLPSKWLDSGYASPSGYLNFNIYSFNFINMTCTGTLISPEGHVLVALHCIEDSISFTNSVALRKEVPQLNVIETVELISGSLHKYSYDRQMITSSMEIPVAFDDSKVFAKIVALGRGMLNPRFTSELENDEVSQKIHEQLSNDGYAIGGDFAIVQIEQLKGLGCYRLANKNPKVGDKVKSISFPCYKDDDKNWPQVRNAKVKFVAPEHGLYVPSNYDKLFLPKGAFATDGFAQMCNSGSSIRNENGEIIGVLHVAYETQENKTESMGITIQRVLELIEPGVRDRLLKLNADCNKIN